MTEAQAYVDGWNACFNGEDGRFTNPHKNDDALNYAWDYGFLDASEADENDAPHPECVGYGCAR
jgi:hypothetical protein